MFRARSFRLQHENSLYHAAFHRVTSDRIIRKLVGLALLNSPHILSYSVTSSAPLVTYSQASCRVYFQHKLLSQQMSGPKPDHPPQIAAGFSI